MRVSFATTFRNSVDAINDAASKMVEAERQVTTGHRIGVASDDPVANAVAMSQSAAIAQLDAYTKATYAASAHLNIADSALNDMVNQLTAAQTAALSAAGSHTA